MSTIDTENTRLTAENTALKEAINKALIEISGGLCYFKAEAKHMQLRDAQRTLQNALTPGAEPANNVLKELAQEIAATADNLSPTQHTYPADVMLEWASRLQVMAAAQETK